MDSSASVAKSCLTLSDPMDYSTPGLPVHHQLPETTQPTSIESVMPSNHLILCPPLLLLPSVFPSVRVFSNESKKLSWVAVYSLRRICCFIRFSYSICWKNRWNSLPPCFGRGSDLFLLLFTSGGQGIGISASASILKWARWLLLMPVSPGKERFLEVYG